VMRVPCRRRRAGCPPRAGNRASPALPEAHQRRIHGSRGPGSHSPAGSRAGHGRDPRLRHRRLRRGRGRTPARPPRRKCASGPPGGRLDIQWAGPGEPIWMTGPAERAFEGEVKI
jgi:hypothetical protein